MNDPRSSLALPDYEGENRAVSYGVYCEACRAEYEQAGMILNNERERLWLDNKIDFEYIA